MISPTLETNLILEELGWDISNDWINYCFTKHTQWHISEIVVNPIINSTTGIIYSRNRIARAGWWINDTYTDSIVRLATRMEVEVHRVFASGLTAEETWLLYERERYGSWEKLAKAIRKQEGDSGGSVEAKLVMESVANLRRYEAKNHLKLIGYLPVRYLPQRNNNPQV